MPAKPPTRNFRPLRSSTVLISLRNKPPICAPVLPAAKPMQLNFCVAARSSAAGRRRSAARRSCCACSGRTAAPVPNVKAASLPTVVVGRRCGPSRRCRSAPRRAPAGPGTISPAAKTWIWNLLSVISATRLAKYSQPPYSVSSDFGQLVVMRHLTSGIDCAMAGAATAVEAASPTPADFRNSRRFIGVSPAHSRLSADATGCALNRRSCWPVTDERLAAILRNYSADANTKKPGAVRPGSASIFGSFARLSGARTRPDHEGVVGVFGHLPPQIFVVAEGRPCCRRPS